MNSDLGTVFVELEQLACGQHADDTVRADDDVAWGAEFFERNGPLDFDAGVGHDGAAADEQHEHCEDASHASRVCKRHAHL